MKAYNTSAATLRAVLKNPLLQTDAIEETMDNIVEALADHKEIEDAIGLGNETAMDAAGADDSDLADELEALVLEQKQEKEAEAEVKRKAEEARKQVVPAIPSTPIAAPAAPTPEAAKPVVHSEDAQKQRERRYEEGQAEKEAQAIRDREAESQVREKWDAPTRQREAEIA